jgi:hypothetical protein
VLKEFYEQGEQEKKLGLPVEPLNDGSKSNVGKGQKGFIGYVVAPLWEIWSDLTLAGHPHDVECEPMKNLHDNMAKWETIIAEGDYVGTEFVEEVFSRNIGVVVKEEEEVTVPIDGAAGDAVAALKDAIAGSEA